MYTIVRHYFEAHPKHRVIRRGLTLEEAQAHCQDPETSSSTCTKSVNVRRTRRLGPWFDSYQEALSWGVADPAVGAAQMSTGCKNGEETRP